MPSIYDVMASMDLQVKAALTGLTYGSPPVALSVIGGVGWPPVTALQNVARGQALYSVYDRKSGRNTTRWSPYSYNQVVVPATLTTAVRSPASMPPMGTGQIQLGGSITAGDAVSAVFNAPQINAPSGTAAVVALSAPGDTPSTMATKLANQINADATLGLWVTAAASGANVNLTNRLSVPVTVSSFAGNGGTQTTELGRRESQLQLTFWTQTFDQRSAVVSAINSMLAALQTNYGPTTADGTPVRLEMQNDFPIEDDTLEDVYRHDFLVTVDFPITTQDALYAVLAAVPSFAVEQS